MRKCYLILLILLLPTLVQGQGIGSGMEQLMSRKVITYNDAGYNTALLIPRLHRENKKDTIAEVIRYVETNFGSANFIVPYIIITQIGAGTFRETIKNLRAPSMDAGVRKYSDSMMYEKLLFAYYLQWYRDNFDIINDEYYPLYFRTAYGDYFEFLVSLSKETLKKPGLSATEVWLLNYFVNPTTEQLAHAGDPEYGGTVLQKSWFIFHRKESTSTGLGAALNTGIWMPTGNLAIVGNHPFVGWTAGGRAGKFMGDLRVNCRFLRSPNYYQVVADTFIFSTNYFFGIYLGLDLGYELYRHKKHAIELLGGAGWENFGTLRNTVYNRSNLDSNAGTFNSLNLNSGLGYKFYYKMKNKRGDLSFTYIGLQVKYNWLFFSNNGGSDFSGGAWTVGLNYGFYSRKVSRYYIDF